MRVAHLVPLSLMVSSRSSIATSWLTRRPLCNWRTGVLLLSQIVLHFDFLTCTDFWGQHEICSQRSTGKAGREFVMHKYHFWPWRNTCTNCFRHAMLIYNLTFSQERLESYADKKTCMPIKSLTSQTTKRCIDLVRSADMYGTVNNDPCA